MKIKLYTVALCMLLTLQFAQGQLSSLKVAESQNAYTYLLLNQNQLVTRPTMGNGGVVGFVFRQNTRNCNGNSGQFRYTLSTDGGHTWKANSNTTVPPNPPSGTCWGMGPLNSDLGVPIVSNPMVTGKAARYPNFCLFSLGASRSIDSLAGVFMGSTLDPAGTGWDGVLGGVATDLQASPTVLDEQILTQTMANPIGPITYSLVQQHPDSNIFFALSSAYTPFLGSRVANNASVLTRGDLDPSTKQITWTTAGSWNIPIVNASPAIQGNISDNQVIAFAPDGQRGYICLHGDIPLQGKDTVYAPILMETNDGGLTWSGPFELNLSAMQGLIDSMQQDTFYDVNGNPIVLDGSAVINDEFDMEVDHLGNPHIFTVIHGNQFQGSRPQAAFYMQYAHVADITRDTSGNWNVIDLGPIQTHHGFFGDDNYSTNSLEVIQLGNHPQVSRSMDGTKLFFTWCDTDAMEHPGNLDFRDDNGNTQLNSNYAPNLFSAGLDLDTYTMTPVKNWTAGDSAWGDSILAPRMADLVLEQGNDWYLPVTTLKLDGISALDQASFHYFDSLRVSSSDFTRQVVWVNGPGGTGPSTVQPSLKTGFQLFPNPAKSSLKLSIQHEYAQEVMILDLNGKILQTQSLSPGQNASTLNITDLPAGMYQVVLKSRDGHTSSRFVKY